MVLFEYVFLRKKPFRLSVFTFFRKNTIMYVNNLYLVVLWDFVFVVDGKI